jgi:hypothetical protein
LSDERKIDFKIGQLDLVLSPRLERADLERMNNGSRRARTGAPLTIAEATKVRDRCAEMLFRCARENSPKLTKEKILREILREMATTEAQVLPQIAIALCQAMEWIPTDAVAV